MDAFTYCQQKVAQSQSSFYYSFLLLPKMRRQAIYNVYAFCREVDDIVDDGKDPSVAMQKLQWWRQEVHHIFTAPQQCTHPIAKALCDTVEKFHLEKNCLIAMIDGMEQDLRQNRYMNFGQLEQYCWKVAGVVGIMTAHILGFQDKKTLEYAEKLGTALQLINIIRDVGEDARRGRIYLPIDDLQRFGVPAQNILQGAYSAAFTNLMNFQAQRAGTIYTQAMAALPTADRKAQRAGLAMGAIYKTMLDEIVRADYQVLHQRIRLPPMRKFYILVKTWLKNA